MSQAIVDPEELEKFAKVLLDFTTHLETGIKFLDGNRSNLSVTWRDQEQRKFEQEYISTVKNLMRFIEISRAHIVLLHKKADHARNYVNQR